MTRRLMKALFLAGLAAALGALPANAAAASPSLRLSVSSAPTNFAPNSTNAGALPEYVISVANVGSMPTSAPFSVTDTLPAGITQHGTGDQVVTLTNDDFNFNPSTIHPGYALNAEISVDVGDLAEGSTATNQVSLSGGGVSDITAQTTTTISSTPAEFGFLPGAQSLEITGSDGLPATQAGSHPDQLTLDFGLPVVQVGDVPASGELSGAGGGIRDLQVALPPGVIVNPAATPVRCTEAQLEEGRCPDASAIGLINVTTTPIADATVQPSISPFYNMQTPPGVAAEFAFDAVGVGIYIHVDGGVHAGDYSLSADTNDILSRFGNPVFHLQTQLWGDPSAPSHDQARGDCATGAAGENGLPCSVTQRDTPLLSLPSACGDSIRASLSADSWIDPGNFHRVEFPATDSVANPVGITGCNSLGAGFAPTLQARPTTNAADSPSGLAVDLHVPQSNSLGTLATPHLKKALVTLPEGLVLNPSSANGLGSCSSNQIGIDPGTARANAAAVACPDDSKIGTVAVDTPLLDHVLPGSIYIAKPYDNPFDSLLAIYLAVEDPQSGVLIKLAGHVQADQSSGRLTTVFDQNPQLPFSDFKLTFKSGPHGILRTPSTCGNYSTTSQLTPWSAPDSGPPAAPHDDYAISQDPNAGSCAATPAQEPNAPSFDAGALTPIAGAYSPFVLHLSRNDGDQQFASLTLTPPPGLVGKLAGTPYCPESSLTDAAAKTGAQEKASPSCPAASQIGTATIGAGAGPAPYYTQGKAYLAGPYKGGPLSVAIVTPATAGPYDLGTVVVRSALNVDPATAQITAVSDPIPSILQGIPLNVRSIALSLDKPNFTLNGTSCDPFAVTGQLVSTLGQAASLSNRFQLAECGHLAFKPKLTLRLKGGTKRSANPALTAILTMKPGEANVVKAVVALPHSEFLDQSHIRTICTRVQYAVHQCPAASVYGTATAFSPLLAAPLSGPVYLRSSSNPLPDLVASLDGQIHIDLDGRIDSARGGIRTSFEAVPDAPVSKFVLQMQGGGKGLLQNSTNICAAVNRASVQMDAQNGKTHDFEPALKAKCGKHHKRHKAHRRGSAK